MRFYSGNVRCKGEMDQESRAAGIQKRETACLFIAGALVLLSFGILPSALVKLQFRPAFLITAGFATIAWGIGGVSVAGASAGWAAAFILYLTGGRSLFLILFAVFILTFVATFAGRNRKKQRENREDRHGRGAAQVLANLGVAIGCMLLVRITGPVAMLCAIAALAEAAADTVSSELGKAYGNATVLVTNFASVPPGTNGGITWLGSMAGAVAALLASFTGVATHIIEPREAVVIAIAAAIGMFIDSLAGATLENHGRLNNEAVNLIGSATAALIAVPLLWLLSRLY